MKIKYYWDPEYGFCECSLTIGNNTFYGQANCHDDDMDMCSERTGKLIAETRAKIAWFQHVKNNELRPQLAALKQLYYSMNRSKYFNPKSYENRMLQRQIHFIKKQLAVVNNDLVKIQQNLKKLLRDKDEFYKAVRKKRALAENNQLEQQKTH